MDRHTINSGFTALTRTTAEEDKMVGNLKINHEEMCGFVKKYSLAENINGLLIMWSGIQIRTLSG